MSDGISADELNLLIEQTYKVEKEFTELKQSYEHLQDTIERVVEFLPNAIWILDANGEIFLQNSKAKDLKELFDLLELENDDYEISFNSSSYLIKSSLYQDKKMLSATDITEQKRKENLATMGQMAAHLSHEIRNPIGSISLLSSALKKKVIPANIPIVEEIQKSVYKIDRIIKATLMFSKGIEAKKGVVKWSQIRDSLESATTYYGYTKNIAFRYPKDDFVIDGDKDLLEMMFSNFVINAIDAIELDDEEYGDVEIVHSEDLHFHTFKIYDTGVEIENKEQLFQAFKSTKVKGNGLGLVLSLQIAEAHGGDVTLLDEYRKGFMIKLLKKGKK